MSALAAFIKKHRIAIGFVAFAAAVILVLAWCRYDLAMAVDGQCVYQIANDEYSKTVDIPRTPIGKDGSQTCIEQDIRMNAGETLYGVRLDFATHNFGFTSGQTHAEILDAQGNVITGGFVQNYDIKDNTFMPVIFDTPFVFPTDGGDAQQYRLRVWFCDPVDLNHTFGVWVSEGAQRLMDETGTLRGEKVQLSVVTPAGASPMDATLALQYVVDYSGKWSDVGSALLAVLILLAVLGGAALLLFGRGRPQMAVLAGMIAMGAAFSFFTPPLVAPDEYTHVANCYRLSSQLLGGAATDENHNLLIRQADEPYFDTKSGDIGIYAYKTYFSHLGETGCGTVADTTTEAWAGTPITPIQHLLYLPQTLGMALARLLGLGWFAMLLLGRLCNLAVYVALGMLALCRISPRWRTMLCCVLLLPMGLQLAGSFSADGMLLGLMFWYTAVCLSLRGQKATGRQMAILLLLSFLLGPAKAIYLPVVLLCLIIPSKNLDLRKEASAPLTLLHTKTLQMKVLPGTLFKLAALALAALNWGINNGGNLLYVLRDVDKQGLSRAVLVLVVAAVLLVACYLWLRRYPKWLRVYKGALIALVCLAIPVGLYKVTHMWGDNPVDEMLRNTLPNGDSVYTYAIGFICRNYAATIKLLLRSVESQSELWLQGIVGTALGEPIVYGVYVSWLLTLGLVAVLWLAAQPAPGQKQGLGPRAKLGVGFILLCVVGLTVVAALSWTPINYATIFGVQGRYWLPVLPLLLLLLGSNRRFSVKKDVTRGAVLSMLCLTSLVLLQGYGIYATWQMQ